MGARDAQWQDNRRGQPQGLPLRVRDSNVLFN